METRTEKIKRLEREVEEGQKALDNNTSLAGSKRLAARYRQADKVMDLLHAKLIDAE